MGAGCYMTKCPRRCAAWQTPQPRQERQGKPRPGVLGAGELSRPGDAGDGQPVAGFLCDGSVMRRPVRCQCGSPEAAGAASAQCAARGGCGSPRRQAGLGLRGPIAGARRACGCAVLHITAGGDQTSV